MTNKIPYYWESTEEIDRIQRRRQIRQRLQNEFNRTYYNPHRHTQHIELLDPMVSRYTAMRASIFEHWRPSWQSWWKTAFLAYIPILVLSYRLHMKFKQRDEDCRSGKVPYEEREIRRF